MIKENLSFFRKKARLTQSDISSHLNITRQMYSAYERGVSTPDIFTLEKIAQILHVNLNELIGNKTVTTSRYIKIPVLGQIQAGLPSEVFENIIDFEEISEEIASKGEHFGLMVTGKSMEPRICEGDVVIVRKQSSVCSGDVAVVLINGEDATLKKIMIRSDSMMLIPYNNTYQTTVYSRKEIQELPVEIIGKVIELRAKF